MIRVQVDEAKAFDELSIYWVKIQFGGKDEMFHSLKWDIEYALGKEKFQKVFESDEYKAVCEANLKTFNMVSKAKKNEVTAQQVEESNYRRHLAKKALQAKHFPTEMREQKIYV